MEHSVSAKTEKLTEAERLSKKMPEPAGRLTADRIREIVRMLFKDHYATIEDVVFDRMMGELSSHATALESGRQLVCPACEMGYHDEGAIADHQVFRCACACNRTMV